jgi:isopentenyl-diphosphate Delta-isomerase
MKELVVLVHKNNIPIGTMEKQLVHSDHTPLHRGFSIFLFNEKKQLLLQQRSRLKITWPLTWSNSCCGHPLPKEPIITAAKRRLKFELGITEVILTIIFPHYRYCYIRQGIVENEICPVLIGTTNQKPIPNPDEVKLTKWLSWKKWLSEIKIQSNKYSEWSTEETRLLNENNKFIKFLKS